MTGTTITVTFRRSNTAENAAIGASGAAPTDDAYVADLQTYIDLFNRSFQLYGRHVVLKAYSGQGDWLQEDVGQDLSGAQADAATAYGTGAFADISHSVYMTVPYATSLAQRGVIAMNTLSLNQSTLEHYSPYLWGFAPNEQKVSAWYSSMICQRLRGQTAQFAGNAAYRASLRTFGLVILDAPNYSEVGDWLTSAAQGCGVHFAYSVKYTSDVTQQPQQAPGIIAQLHAHAVNSVVFYGDYNMLKELMAQADVQSYAPEWVIDNGGDVGGRGPSQDQMADAIGNGDYFFVDWPTKSDSDAYRAYRLANPTGQPQEPYYAMAYYGLMQLFDGLQAAGPDLTPANFASGMFSLPSTSRGNDGTWAFGAGAYTPPADTQIMHWNPKATSNIDGKAGAWVACDGGAWYPFAQPNSWGSPRPLSC